LVLRKTLNAIIPASQAVTTQFPLEMGSYGKPVVRGFGLVFLMWNIPFILTWQIPSEIGFH
jgi:hypothetical protein